MKIWNFVDGNEALNFKENEGENNWINSGFFILSKRVFDYLDDDQTIWEEGPLNKLAKNKQLGVWKHDGFWYPMDSLRDKLFLEKLWKNKKAPWKKW